MSILITKEVPKGLNVAKGILNATILTAVMAGIATVIVIAVAHW